MKNKYIYSINKIAKEYGLNPVKIAEVILEESSGISNSEFDMEMIDEEY